MKGLKMNKCSSMNKLSSGNPKKKNAPVPPLVPPEKKKSRAPKSGPKNLPKVLRAWKQFCDNEKSASRDLGERDI